MRCRGAWWGGLQSWQGTRRWSVICNTADCFKVSTEIKETKNNVKRIWYATNLGEWAGELGRERHCPKDGSTLIRRLRKYATGTLSKTQGSKLLFNEVGKAILKPHGWYQIRWGIRRQYQRNGYGWYGVWEKRGRGNLSNLEERRRTSLSSQMVWNLPSHMTKSQANLAKEDDCEDYISQKMSWNGEYELRLFTYHIWRRWCGFVDKSASIKDIFGMFAKIRRDRKRRQRAAWLWEHQETIGTMLLGYIVFYVPFIII